MGDQDLLLTRLREYRTPAEAGIEICAGEQHIDQMPGVRRQ
ncbi:MAG: hypothetical protein ACRD09_12770 [Vicinamibacterales bacterium]